MGSAPPPPVTPGSRRLPSLALVTLVTVACGDRGPTWIEVDPRWSLGTPLPVGLTGVAAAAFQGAIYVAGGESDGGPSRAVYRSGPDGAWERLADLPVQREGGQLVVSDGALYLVGGWEIRPPGNAFYPARDVWLYLPAVDEWVQRAPLPDLRQGTAVGVPDGIVVVGGGFGSVEHGGTYPGDSVAVYTSVTDVWRYGAPLRTPRYGPMAVAVGSRIHVFGGLPAVPGESTDGNEIYDVAADTWAPGGYLYADYMLAFNAGYARVADHVHFFGGLVARPGGGFLRLHMRYDLTTERWETMPFMPTPRAKAAAVALEGRIHVIGGSVGLRGSPGWTTPAVEVFSTGS